MHQHRLIAVVAKSNFKKNNEAMAGALKQPYAIIAGLESMQGLQAARILRQRNVPVIAIVEDRNHFSCRTNCCEKIIEVENGLANTLKILGPQLKERAVLFPCTDDYVLLISRHRQILSQWYHIRLPNPNVVDIMIDKVKFYDFAIKNNFSIPRTFLLYSEDDLANAVQGIAFPCVLKPHYRDTQWNANSSFKAFKVKNAEELCSLYRKYRQWAGCLIAQEWIEGPDANLYSCNCYFDEKSRPLVTFVARKLRQWPPEAGQSSLGEECRNDLVLQETLRLFSTAGFCGLGYLEMKRDDRTGGFFIVEPNIGRPTGRSAIAEAGGVELLYTMYCDAIGRPLPANRQQQYGDVKWIHLRRDFQSAFYYWLRGELTSRQWLQSWRGRKTYALFSLKDPGPFLGDLARAVRLFLSKKERVKRDFTNPLLEKTGGRS